MSESEPQPSRWIGVVLRQPNAPQEQVTALDTIARRLAGGYAVVTVLLTTIGTLEGGLGRLLLNHLKLTLAGVVLTLVGLVVAFLGAYLLAEEKHNRRWAAVVVALLAFVGGIGLIGYAEARSLSDNERPTITTTASMAAEGSKLEGHITAGGVKADEWVYLRVNGFQATTEDDPTNSAGVEGTKSSKAEGPMVNTLLYQTRAGPDRNGKVDFTFNIPVVLARFDFIRIGATRAHTHKGEEVDACFVLEGPSATDQSCSTVYLSDGPKRPTLSVTWEKGTGVNFVNVGVKAEGADPDDVVLLDVRSAKTGQVFYRSMFSGSSTGVVDATAKVAVRASVKKVCVVGEMISATNSAALTRQPRRRTCRLNSFDLSHSSFAITALP